MLAAIPLALQILGLIAPHAGDIVGGIASMLGGPRAAETAKAVVDKATAVFGTSDPEQIKLLIAQDATRAQRYVAEMQADVEKYRIEVADIQNARARDLAIHQIVDEKGVPAGTNIRANILLFGAFVMLVAILIGALIYRASIPDTVMAMMSMIAGGLVGNLTQAFNFEFGSSRSSSEKSDQIKTMANTAATIASTAADVATRK